jgi:hypothetical protein
MSLAKTLSVFHHHENISWRIDIRRSSLRDFPHIPVISSLLVANTLIAKPSLHYYRKTWRNSLLRLSLHQNKSFFTFIKVWEYCASRRVASDRILQVVGLYHHTLQSTDLPKALLRSQQVQVSILHRTQTNCFFVVFLSPFHQTVRFCFEMYHGYYFPINQSELLITVHFITFAGEKAPLNSPRTSSYSRLHLIRIRTKKSHKSLAGCVFGLEASVE